MHISYSRSEQSGQHSENDAIEHDPSCYFNRPILGVRIGAGGQRLVYRVNRPRTAVCYQIVLP